MRIITAAFALGAASLLCNAGIAQARTTRVVHEPRTRIVVRPLPEPTPYWDSNIVPRYRYRPEDDRVDPYGPPVVPVIRYGNQEMTVRPWWYW
jgi:hypothetical protein